jgi:large subunit ribosomal protein L25
MLKDIQGHPLKQSIYHVDFLEVSEKQAVEVALPVSLVGEPIGVKRDKGILEHILRELHVTCPANAIPEKIEVDITDLALGETIHVSDLVLTEGLKAKDDPKQSVVSVVAPKEEEAVAAEGEEAEEKAEKESGTTGKEEGS